MYKYIVDPKIPNDKPVVVGRKVTATTSKQVREYLLCTDCEARFNNGGERWILKQVWNGKNFPLRDKLSLAMYHYKFPGVEAISGSSAGVDTEKLGYFALSVVWRAGVRVWSTPFGGSTRLLALGGTEEIVRRYLLGETPFPAQAVVVVHVCTDWSSTGSFYMPSHVVGPALPCEVLGFQCVGINFRLYLGASIPNIFRDFCCVRSSSRLIFIRDCSQKTEEAFGQILSTSRPAKGMK